MPVIYGYSNDEISFLSYVFLSGMVYQSELEMRRKILRKDLKLRN